MSDPRDREPPSNHPPEKPFDDAETQEFWERAELYAVEMGCTQEEAFGLLLEEPTGVPGKRPRTNRLQRLAHPRRVEALGYRQLRAVALRRVLASGPGAVARSLADLQPHEAGALASELVALDPSCAPMLRSLATNREAGIVPLHPTFGRTADTTASAQLVPGLSMMLGNAAARSGPADVFERATQGEAQPLPHREKLERAFGEDFRAVEFYPGRRELGEVGARGAAKGNKIATQSATPSVSLLAHEATHVAQQRRHGTLSAAASRELSDHTDASEREADLNAAISARGLDDDVRLSADAAPSARLHLDRGDLEDPFTSTKPRSPKHSDRDRLEDPWGEGKQPLPHITMPPASPSKEDTETKAVLGLPPAETKRLAELIERHLGTVEKESADTAKNAKDGAGKRLAEIKRKNPGKPVNEKKAKELDVLRLKVSLAGVGKGVITSIPRELQVRFFEKALVKYGVKKMSRGDIVMLLDRAQWTTNLNHSPQDKARWEKWLAKKIKGGHTTVTYTGRGVWHALELHWQRQERIAKASREFRKRLRNSTYAQDAILTFYKAHVNGVINILNGAISLATWGKVKEPIKKIKYRGAYAKKYAGTLEGGATLAIGIVSGGLVIKGFTSASAYLASRVGGATVGGVSVVGLGSKLVTLAQVYLAASGVREVHVLAEQVRDDVILLLTKDVSEKRKKADGTEVTVTRPATPAELKAALERVIMTAAGSAAGAGAGRVMRGKQRHGKVAGKGASSGKLDSRTRTALKTELGVHVVENSKLGNAVRVHYKADSKTGHVSVAKVEHGPSATVAQVRAHRQTIDRLRRYNGIVGKLRRTWDRFRGRANPHDRVTERSRWEAWEEIQKLDTFISEGNKRLASATGDAANVLQRELKALNAVRRRFERLERRASGGRARGYVGSPNTDVKARRLAKRKARKREQRIARARREASSTHPAFDKAADDVSVHAPAFFGAAGIDREIRS